MLFDCNRRSLAAVILLLFSLGPQPINTSTITSSAKAVPTNLAPTCDVRTINYITDSLPQLCFKSSWSANGTSPKSIPPANATAVTDGQSVETVVTTTQVSDQRVAGQVGKDNSTAAREPSLSTTVSSPTETQVVEDEASELNEEAFLSFEEWKKQALEKAGQQNSNVGSRKSNGENKKDTDGLNSNMGAFGEEGEIEIDFGVFRSSGMHKEASQISEVQDGELQDQPQEQEKTKRNKDQTRGKDAGITCKERFSYASFDAGATVLKTHKGAKNSKAVLVENKDTYMLSQCSIENKFLIIELSEDIWIDTVVLANYEFFSSMIRTFRVSVSDRYPVKTEKWKDAGTYEARNSRDIQAFLVENPHIWARYIRIEFLSHYGAEYYCPLSLVRVHGTRMLESWKESESIGEDEDTGDTEDESEQYIPEAIADVVQEEERLTAKSKEDAEETIRSIDDAKRKRALAEDTPQANITTPWVRFGFPVSQPADPVIDDGICLPAEAPIKPTPTSQPTKTLHSTAIPPVNTSTITDSNTSTGISTSVHSNGSAPTEKATIQIPSSNAPAASDSTTSSSIPDTITTNSTAPTSSQATKTQNVSTSQKNKTTSTSSASSSLPTIQESFFKAVSRRLQLLESNSTLSLQYIEQQSKTLREAFSKVEKKQLQRSSTFLDTLNNTVLAELRGFRQQYDEIWQSTIISLESQREESRKEILAISARLSILADEVVFQKRMSIVQSVLLLLCLGLVIFSRVSASGDFPMMYSRGRHLSADSPLQSPSESPEFRRTVSMRSGRSWNSGHMRNESAEFAMSRSRSRGGREEEAPPTPVSAYSRSEQNFTPPSGPEEAPAEMEHDLPEPRSERLELPRPQYNNRRRSGSSSWQEQFNTILESPVQSSPEPRPTHKSQSFSAQLSTRPHTEDDEATSPEATPQHQSRPYFDSEDNTSGIGLALGSPRLEFTPEPSQQPETEAELETLEQHFSIARKPLPALPSNLNMLHE